MTLYFLGKTNNIKRSTELPYRQNL